MEILVNQNCAHCGLCVKVCPAHLFEAGKERGDAPGVPNPEACIRCGHCVCVCPAEAIEHSEFAPEKKILTGTEALPTWETFLELLASRRSVRVFRQEPVSREALQKIIHAAELAPTACNARHVHWTAVTNPEILREVWQETVNFLERAVKLMDSWPGRILAKMLPNSELGKNYPRLPMMKSLLKSVREKDWILYGAPALLIAHCEKRAGRFAPGDAQLAIQNAALAACTLGLGTFYVGFVTRAAERNPAVGKLLQIPDGHQIAGGITVGVPAVSYRFTPVREYPEVTFLD